MSFNGGVFLLILGCNIVYCNARKIPCAGFPCKNGGKCIEQGDGYSCLCVGSYKGKHCEIKKGDGFCDSKDDGNYKDPDNCYGFITCSNHIEYKRDCPDGLKYNKAKDWCDWPKNVHCGGPDKGGHGFCKGKYDGNYIDPDNCFGFISCSNHVVHKRDCPAGLKYNVKRDWCDWPRNVLCNPGQVSCRNKKDGDYPDPGTIYGYVTCSHGLAYKIACPSGQKFNPRSKVCEGPPHKKC